MDIKRTTNIYALCSLYTVNRSYCTIVQTYFMKKIMTEYPYKDICDNIVTLGLKKDVLSGDDITKSLMRLNRTYNSLLAF